MSGRAARAAKAYKAAYPLSWRFFRAMRRQTAYERLARTRFKVFTAPAVRFNALRWPLDAKETP